MTNANSWLVSWVGCGELRRAFNTFGVNTQRQNLSSVREISFHFMRK